MAEKKRNRVVQILMDRDGLTEEEAKREISYCRELIEEAVADGNFFEADEIIADNLGLEPDYIFDII